MWEAREEASSSGRVLRIELSRSGSRLRHADVIELWQRDGGFRDFFLGLLRDAPHEAYFWETPPVRRATLGQPFEFALIESPELARVRAEPEVFRARFESGDPEQPVLRFPNLGGDALLVVPRPLAAAASYAHLAAFVRGAPPAQVHALWQTAAAALQEQIGARPTWLSSAGLGVYWLHLRLDSRPKYYRCARYTTAA